MQMKSSLTRMELWMDERSIREKFAIAEALVRMQLKDMVSNTFSSILFYVSVKIVVVFFITGRHR